MTGSPLENKAQPIWADPLASGPWVLGRQPICRIARAVSVGMGTSGGWAWWLTYRASPGPSGR